jgi:predicted transcriptional regulator
MNKTFRPTRRGLAAVLGRLEAEVMEAVWAAGTPVTVSDIAATFDRRRKKLAYSTLKTILTNLAEKGYLQKRPAGRANEFSPLKMRPDLEREVVRDVLGSLMRDYRNPLLAHLADEFAQDPTVTAELDRLVAERKAQRKRD